jgi:hypothetical protein
MKHVSSFFELLDFDKHLRPTPFSHAGTLRVAISEVKKLGPWMSVGLRLLDAVFATILRAAFGVT